MVTDPRGAVWLLGSAPGADALEAALRQRGWNVLRAATAAAFAAERSAPHALVMLAPRMATNDGGERLTLATAAAVCELVAGAQHAVKRMAKAAPTGRRGAIVVVTDIAGVIGRAGNAAQATLGGALIGAAKCLAKELGRQDVAVNVVAHGLMPALGTEDRLAPAEAKLFSMMQLGKPGDIEGLVDNIEHLIAKRHGMTGQVLHVDDGLVI